MNLAIDRQKKCENAQKGEKKDFNWNIIKTGLQSSTGKRNLDSAQALVPKINDDNEKSEGKEATGKIPPKISGSKSVLKKKSSIQANIIPTIRLQGFKEKVHYESCKILVKIDLNKIKEDFHYSNIVFKEIIEKLNDKYKTLKVCI